MKKFQIVSQTERFEPSSDKSRSFELVSGGPKYISSLQVANILLLLGMIVIGIIKNQ